MPRLAGEVNIRDRVESQLLADFDARRVAFAGDDGFPLGGVLLAPRAKPRPRAAVVLVEASDTLAAYDSLAFGLRRMGFAVMLLEPRGSGRSVGPSCPLPSTWRGREAEMQSWCAGDVPAAVRALAREARADTSRYLLVGVCSTAPVAAEAARHDRRAAVLMLVTPGPSPADRGHMRADLEALKRPIYFQTGPEDYTAYAVLDSLYRGSDMRISRIAESEQRGTRATLFRYDPHIWERFKVWLAESWPRTPAKRATPPSRRRTG